jgi:hypothetical protein
MMQAIATISKKLGLEDWILEALTDDQKEGCRQLSLVHVLGTPGGIIHDEIDVVRLSPATSNDPNVIGARFRHKAQVYAQELIGVQSFMILAFYGASKDPQAKHPFMVNGETSFQGLATEGPTETGQKQQNMRLTEAIVQGSFRQNAMTFDMMIRTFDAITRVNATLQSQLAQSFEVLFEERTARLADNNEFRLKENDRKLIEKMIDLAPSLINNMTGKDIFPQSSADSALINAIADELTPEKVQALQAVVPPKLWPLIAKRFEEHLKKQIEQAKAPAVSNGSAAKDVQ